MRSFAVAVLAVLLGVSCADMGETPEAAGPPREAPTDLVSAQAAWRQAGITDYTMEVRVSGCFCPGPMEYSVTVVDGQVTEHTSPSVLKQPDVLTVDELFRWLGFWGPDALKATYNDVGVPIEAHIDAKNVVDEQADYAVSFQAT